MPGGLKGLVDRTRECVAQNKYLVVGALLIVALVMMVGINIILTPGTIMYGDFNTPRETDRFELYPMWTQYGQYSNLDKVDRLLGFGVPVSIAIALDVPTELFIKMMILGTLLIAGLASYLSAYWLGRKVYPQVGQPSLCIAAFAVSVVYMFNPWSMSRIEHFFLWTGYALAPLILIGAMKGLEDHDRKTLVITGVLWMLASTSVHYTVFLSILVFGALLCQRPLRMSWSERQSLLGSFLILLASFLITSLYWIIPYLASLLGGSGGPQTVLTVEVLNMLSANSTPMNAIRGIGYWWPRVDIVAHGGLEALWSVAGYMVPIIAFGALLFRRDRLTLALAGMAVLFFILSMGTNWPLGGIYSWLTFDAPLSGQVGWLLRDPDKWAGPLWLTYALLIMITLLGLANRLKTKLPGLSIRKQETVAVAIVCALLLSAFTIFAAPSVNGHINGVYSPVEVPKEYDSTNDWLASLDGDFNVIWLPSALGLSTNWTSGMVSNIENMYSGKPDIGGTTIYGSYYRSFLTQTLAENRTDQFGRLLAPSGIKYLVLREDIPSLSDLIQSMESSLSWQKDMTMVREDGALKVYEVLEDISLVYATDNIISAIGGLSDLRSLCWIDGFNTSMAGVLFPQQTLGPPLIGGTYLISNARQEDLVLLEGAGSVVAPYDSTDHHDPAGMWSKASTLDPLHGTWREYLEERGIDGWYFDYGLGTVLTWVNGTEPGSIITMSMSVPADGQYRISCRYLESVQGGSMTLMLDGVALTNIDSRSEVNGFSWDTVGQLNLTAGEHTLSIINNKGFNAVNLLLITGQSEWDEAIAGAQDQLSGSNTAYLMEAEDSMIIANGESRLERAGDFSQGEAVTIFPGEEYSGTLNVLSDNDFRLGIVGTGELEIVIDGASYLVNGTFPDVSYSGMARLSVGEHTVTVINRGSSDAIIDTIWLFSGQETSLDALFNGGRSTASVITANTANPTAYPMAIQAEGRFLLVTGTVYDSNWVASTDQGDVASRPTWGYLNGFILNVSGSTSITAEYRPQSWLYVGGAVSIAGALIFFPALIVYGRGRKRDEEGP
ncbi:MAG: hypothetical protein ISF22_09730 [Methanomassiliicoccus sp.]|nr:hypothetical protein [Methanomassiliicoccus sp.]